MGSLGITIPLAPPLGEHGAIVARLIEAGYDQVWTAETAGYDAFSPLLLASQHGDVRLGTAIASVLSRGPALLAMQAAALAEAAPGRVAIGVGASSPAVVEGWNGRPYERPVAHVADTVRVLRAALAGERVSGSYDSFTLRGFRLERPPRVAPPLLVAALRPKMLEVAGAVADGAILNWLAPQDVEVVAPLVHAGGPAKEIVARIFVVPCDDAAAVRAAAKPFIARYLTVPGYAAFHGWLGRGDVIGPMVDAIGRKAIDEAAAAVPDELVDDLIVHGSPSACAEGIARYRAGGVTTPVVKILPLLAGRDEVDDAVAVARSVVPLVAP